MSTFIGSRPAPKEICRVTFTNWNKTVECKPHTNLRALAIQNDLRLFNGVSRVLNCLGHGTCGSCMVEVVPQTGVTPKGAFENLRFFQVKGNLRQACRVEVTGDIEVTKHAGFFGTRGYEYRVPREEVARLYREGSKTLEEIATHFQCSVAEVAQILEASKVELRREGSAA